MFLRQILCLAALAGLIYCLGQSRERVAGVAPVELSGAENFVPEEVQVAEAVVVESAGCIVIDAGHGGQDGGAVVGELREKDYTLLLALELERELLAKNYQVHMTRRTDETVALSKRPGIANSLQADLLVSIHLNTSPDPSAHGVETFYSHPKALREQWARKVQQQSTQGSEKLLSDQEVAEIVQQAILEKTGARNRGTKNSKMMVTRKSEVPAVLVECGFLTNEKERAFILTEQYRSAIVAGLSAGVEHVMAQNRERLLQAEQESLIVKQP